MEEAILPILNKAEHGRRPCTAARPSEGSRTAARASPSYARPQAGFHTRDGGGQRPENTRSPLQLRGNRNAAEPNGIALKHAFGEGAGQAEPSVLCSESVRQAVPLLRAPPSWSEQARKSGAAGPLRRPYTNFQREASRNHPLAA